MNIRPSRLTYMGSGGVFEKYAPAYLDERMWQIEKDMTICLSGRRADNGKGFDHAYFPALKSCCGMLELLANLYGGSTKLGKARYERLYSYRPFLPHQCYSEDNLSVLYQLLRNSLAHHGTAAGVWIQNDGKVSGRRVTWKLTADNRNPALSLVAENGLLTKDSPWDTAYTHRFWVRLGRMWRDIKESVDGKNGYRFALISDPTLMQRFKSCMEDIYPNEIKRWTKLE